MVVGLLPPLRRLQEDRRGSENVLDHFHITDSYAHTRQAIKKQKHRPGIWLGLTYIPASTFRRLADRIELN